MGRAGSRRDYFPEISDLKADISKGAQRPREKSRSVGEHETAGIIS